MPCLDAMFGHLISDEVWIMLDDEVQRYVSNLGETLLDSVCLDLLGTIE